VEQAPRAAPSHDVEGDPRHLGVGTRKTIRIHPMLDDPKVPGFYIDSVIHHEMAHIAIPSEVGGTGRMHHHTPKFRALERRYPWFEAAMAWEKANLGGLIRAWCSRHRKPKTVRQKSSATCSTCLGHDNPLA
jgi:predicted SprT family Zn-dependent metalloprotease